MHGLSGMHAKGRQPIAPGAGPQLAGPRVSLAANEFGDARLNRVEDGQKAWYQRSEIGKPIGFRLKYNDGNRERNQILLEG
jgi:hypothetical protein